MSHVLVTNRCAERVKSLYEILERSRDAVYTTQLEQFLRGIKEVSKFRFLDWMADEVEFIYLFDSACEKILWSAQGLALKSPSELGGL